MSTTEIEEEPNTYKGILKPLSEDYVKLGIKRKSDLTPDILQKHPNLTRTTYSSIRISPFDHCCGASCLVSFPTTVLGGTRNNGWNVPSTLVPRENDMSYVALHIDTLLQKESARSYCLATINNAQKYGGIAEVLEDYFGFYQLDDPFINKLHNSRVYVYGLCINKYAKAV